MYMCVHVHVIHARTSAPKDVHAIYVYVYVQMYEFVPVRMCIHYV